MSELFFEIMQLQPNDTEFMSAVRDSNSKETAYKLGFMHGRSYAAQMADNHRDVKNCKRLAEALNMLLDNLSPADGWTSLDLAKDNAGVILAELENQQ